MGFSPKIFFNAGSYFSKNFDDKPWGSTPPVIFLRLRILGLFVSALSHKNGFMVWGEIYKIAFEIRTTFMTEYNLPSSTFHKFDPLQLCSITSALPTVVCTYLERGI